MIAIRPNVESMPRGMRWVIFASLLFLMLTPSRVDPVREILIYLRWVPLFVLGALVFMRAAWNHSLPRPINSADTLILAFVSLALLSSLYSIDVEISLLRGISVLLVYGAVFWGMWSCADAYGVESLARIIVTVVMIGFGLHVVFTVLFPLRSFPYYGRLAGWAENPGTLGALAAITMPLVFWRVIDTGRWYYSVLAGVMLVGVLLSQARVEMIAIVVGSGFFLMRSLAHRKLLVLVAAAAFLGAVLVWGRIGTGIIIVNIEKARYASMINEGPHPLIGEAEAEYEVTDTRDDALSTDGVLTDGVLTDGVLTDGVLTDGVLTDGVLTDGVPTDGVLTDGVLTDGVPTALDSGTSAALQQLEADKRTSIENYVTLSGRLDKWYYGMRYFLEKPLLGFGFGTESQLFAYHDRPPNDYVYTGGYFHNAILGMALQLGLVGATLFFVPQGCLILRELRELGAPQRIELRDALLGVLLSGMTSALLSSDLYSMGNPKAIFYWMCVMLVFRYSHITVTHVDA